MLGTDGNIKKDSAKIRLRSNLKHEKTIRQGKMSKRALRANHKHFTRDNKLSLNDSGEEKSGKNK